MINLKGKTVKIIEYSEKGHYDQITYIIVEDIKTKNKYKITEGKADDPYITNGIEVIGIE